METVESVTQELYQLKADYSAHLDQLRDLILEISKGGQAHAECTDRSSPTGQKIKKLCSR